MVKSYIGDIGTRLRIKTYVNLTDLSGAYFRILKPDNTEVNWNCTVENTLTGIVYYDILSGDFDMSGRYNVTTDITLTNGSHWSTETRSFDIFEVYD